MPEHSRNRLLGWRRPARIAAWVLGVPGALVGGFVLLRALRDPLIGRLYDLADGERTALVALILGIVAAGPLLGLAALLVRRRWGAIGHVLWVPVAFSAVVLLLVLPGRNDDGRTERALDAATRGAGDVYGSGDVLVGAGIGALVAALVGMYLVGFVYVSLVPADAARPGRALALGAAYVAVWTVTGAVTVHAVGGPGGGRADWIESYLSELRAGESGLLGSFDPSVTPSRVAQVSCADAATALAVDGRRPGLDGCRTAIVVDAEGRYGAQRRTSGRVAAVIVVADGPSGLRRLDAALEGVTLTTALGLPAPPGPTRAVTSSPALAVVVSAEDPGEIPIPGDRSAADLPLSRALGYLMLDMVTGLPVAPD